MTFVAHDPSSSESRFDEAVRLVKILAANEGPDLLRDGETSNEGPSQTSKQRGEAGAAHIDLNDLADATGVQATESDLRYILNAFEFNIEEREPSEKACSDKRDNASAEGESEHALRRGPSDAERTSPANLDCPPDQKNPSLKIIAGMITLEEVATAVVLAIALVSWLSVQPVEPAPDAPMKRSFEQSASGGSVMSGTADAAPVAATVITGYSARRHSDPQAATLPAIVEAPIPPVTSRLDTLHPFPERAGAGGSRPVRQDLALAPDAPPPSDATRNTLAVSGVAALADRAAGQEKLFHDRPGGTENPDGRSVGASAFQNIDFDRHPSPGDSLPPPVLPSEAGETQAVEVDFTSSTVVPSRQPDPSTSHATTSATVEIPRVSAAKTEETLRLDRAVASFKNLAFLRDQTQVLRLRAEREMREVQAKLILSQEVMPQPHPQTTAAHIQIAAQGRLPPESEPVSTSNSSREQRLILRAELLLKNADISGARLILESAVASGSTRATYLLAQTYDPRILQDKWNVRGIQGDPAKAQSLYSRAQAGSVRIGADPVSGPEGPDRDLGVGLPVVRQGPDQD